MFGLYDEENGASHRAVVIIDKQGVVRFKCTYKTVFTSGPTGQRIVRSDLEPSEILAEIDKIQLSF